MTEVAGLKELLRRLAALEHRFTTVTPETHALVNRRPGIERARTLRDVLGWNRSLSPEILPAGLFDALRTQSWFDLCNPADPGGMTRRPGNWRKNAKSRNVRR